MRPAKLCSARWHDCTFTRVTVDEIRDGKIAGQREWRGRRIPIRSHYAYSLNVYLSASVHVTHGLRAAVLYQPYYGLIRPLAYHANTHWMIDNSNEHCLEHLGTHQNRRYPRCPNAAQTHVMVSQTPGSYSMQLKGFGNHCFTAFH